MGFKDWLIPKEKIFFKMLEEISENVLDGAHILHTMVNQPNDSAVMRQNIKDVERKGDSIVHQFYEELNRSFITPIDHEDLGKLATLYDDVLDIIFAMANRVHLYKITKPNDSLKKFSQISVDAVELLHESFAYMKQLKANKLSSLLIEVHRLEEAADELLNESVAKLFDDNDVIMIIKLKELYESFEQVTDQCEDVAILLRDITIKYG